MLSPVSVLLLVFNTASSSCLSGPYAVLTKDTMPQTYKRKRSWSRAVFSNLQRKGLEKRFEIQKYVTKPDRKQLAAMLGLTDAQVRMRGAGRGGGEHARVLSLDHDTLQEGSNV